MENNTATSTTGRFTVLASRDALRGNYPGNGLQLLNTDDLKAALHCLLESGETRCSILDSQDSEQYFSSVGWIRIEAEDANLIESANGLPGAEVRA